MIDWKHIAKLEYDSAMTMIELLDYSNDMIRRHISKRNKILKENQQLRKALRELTYTNVPIEHFKSNKDAYVTAVELLKNNTE